MAEDTRVIRQPDGKWLVPPKSPAPITHANARSMAQKRWEKYRQAAVRRIVGEATSIDPTAQTPAEAFGLVAAKQYTTLMDSDRPRIADLEKLGQIMTGISGEESQRENAQSGTISVTPDTLLELASRMEQEIASRLERSKAIDAESTDIRNE